jgi:hypothetical protein
MAAQGVDRGTRALDLFVAPDPDNIERLRSALRAVFDDPDIALITSEDLAGDYPAVQYGPPDVDYTIDILSRLGEAFRFEDLEVERVRAGAVVITVVTPATLYRMKRDTTRLRDRDDALRLARAFGLAGAGDDRGRREDGGHSPPVGGGDAGTDAGRLGAAGAGRSLCGFGHLPCVRSHLTRSAGRSEVPLDRGGRRAPARVGSGCRVPVWELGPRVVDVALPCAPSPPRSARSAGAEGFGTRVLAHDLGVSPPTPGVRQFDRAPR